MASPGCGCTGGSVFGGADPIKALEDYTNKGLFERNQQIVDAVIKSLRNVLGDKKSSPQALFEKAKNLLEPVITKKSKFAEEGKLKFLKALAAGINDVIPGSINTNENDMSKVALQVKDALVALQNGVSADFVNIKSNLEIALKNMHTLKDLLEREFNEVSRIVENSSDEATRYSIMPNKDFFDRSIKELTRQTDLIGALLSSTVLPADASLQTLLKDSQNYKSLISQVVSSDRADISPGIAYAILTKGDIAKSREILGEVLRKLGSSLSEYKKSSSFLAFKEDLYKNITHLSNSKDPKAIQNFIEALKTLENFAYLSPAMLEGVTGGAALFTGSNSITERLRKTDSARTIILGDFKRIYKLKKQALIDSIALLAPKIGTESGEIQPSAELRHFIGSLGQMSFSDKDGFERALVNYTQTAEAQLERDRYLTNVKIIYNCCKALQAESGNSHFTGVIAAINDMMELIDNVASNVTPVIRKPLLGDLSRNAQVSGGDDEDNVAGGDDDNVDPQQSEKSDDPSAVVQGGARPQYFTFNQVVMLLNYYYTLAGSKEARKALGAQLESIQAESNELTAREMARLRDEQELEYKLILDNLADYQRNHANGGGELGDAFRAVFTGAASDNQTKVINGVVEAMKELYKRRRDIRVRLIRVAEFINGVLGAFIEAFSKNPDNISELNELLESIEVNHKWYSSRSQDQLKKIFNVLHDQTTSLNGSIAGVGGLAAGINGVDLGDKLVETGLGVNGVGPNFIPVGSKVVGDVFDRLLNGIKSVKALDNIINVFMKLAGKYATTKFESSGVRGGGDDSMSAGFIKEALIEYMALSGIKFNETRTNIISNLKPRSAAFVNGVAVPRFGGGDPGDDWKASAELFDQEKKSRETQKTINPTINANSLAQEKLLAGIQGGELEFKCGDSFESTVQSLINAIHENNKGLGELNTKLDEMKESAEQYLSKSDKTVDGMKDFINTASQGLFEVEAVLRGKGDSDEIKQRVKRNNKFQLLLQALHMIPVDDVASFQAAALNVIREHLSKQSQVSGGSVSGGAVNLVDLIKIQLKTVADADDETLDQNGLLFDKLFDDVLKSMIAKPLVIAGSYSLYHQPRSRRDYGFTTMIRTVLGGGSVRVYDELTESYVRLVLLAEWFRSLFTERNAGVAAAGPGQARGVNLGFGIDGTNKIITMIAEGNGVWSPFLELIFNKLDFVNNGGYSSSDVENIISTVNDAYEKLKSRVNKRDIARSLCQNLVDEVNSKYGILKADELTSYLTKRDEIKFNAGPIGAEETDDDIDLIGAANRFTNLPVRSDKYVTVNAIDSKTFEKEFTLGLRNLVGKFRNKIDDDIKAVMDSRNLQGNLKLTDSMENTIIRYEQDISNESTQDGKLKIIRNFLQGTNAMRGIGSERIAMVLDAVITPLAVLRDLTVEMKQLRVIIETIIARQEVAGANQDLIVLQLYRWVYRETQLPDSLIKLNITQSGGIALDISDLREYVDKLMYCVRENLNKFVNILPKEIIETLTKQINAVDQELVRKIMKGDTSDRIGDLNIAIQKLMELGAPAGAGYETRLTMQNAAWNLANVGLVPGIPAANPAVGGNWDEVNASENGTRYKFVNNTFPNLISNVNIGVQDRSLNLDMIIIPDWLSVNPPGPISKNLSLICMFNRQFVQFIRANLDINNKIYLPLINQFINGPAANDVFSNGMRWNGNAAVNPGEISPDGALLIGQVAKSLAAIATRKVDRQEKLRFATVALTDVLPSMKEKMKVVLPLYMRIFDDLGNHANYNKMLILNSKLPAYSDATRQAHMKICDLVMAGCSSLRTSCAQVYKELADTPVYGEIYADSLAEFKNRFGGLPLLPYSYLYLADVDQIVSTNLTGGEDNFKFLYASRQIMHPDKVATMETVAPARNLLDRYNSVVNATAKIDKALYEKQVNIMLKMLRNRFSRRLFTSITSIDGTSAVPFPVSRLGGNLVGRYRPGGLIIGAVSPAFAAAFAAPALGVGIDLSAGLFVQLVTTNESNFLETKLLGLANIAPVDVGIKDAGNRAELRVINFVDLGIVPINIHMLQREIALANVINYSSTYDTFHNYLVAGFRPAAGRTNGLINTISQNNSELVPTNSKVKFIQEMAKPNGVLEPDVPAYIAFVNSLNGVGGLPANVTAAIAAARGVAPAPGAACIIPDAAIANALALPAVRANAIPATRETKDAINRLIALPGATPASVFIGAAKIHIKRFNSKVITNISNIAEYQRIMNLFLRHIATRLNSPISKGYASIAYEQTEFNTLETNDDLGGPFDQFDSFA